MAAVWDSCYIGRNGDLPFAKGKLNWSSERVRPISIANHPGSWHMLLPPHG